MIDVRLLEVVVCPRCRSSLELSTDALVCSGDGCGLVYRVSDGVPVLLVDEARPTDRGDGEQREG